MCRTPFAGLASAAARWASWAGAGGEATWLVGWSPVMRQEFSVWYPGCPVGPAVARTATLSSTPTTAVAVSGIVYGLWKPAMAACGADVAPISSAAQPDQRRPAWN